MMRLHISIQVFSLIELQCLPDSLFQPIIYFCDTHYPILPLKPSQ